MNIVVSNCSSPGALFSDNTNNSILKIFNWIEVHGVLEIRFIEFRKRIVHDTGINDNNARNICPLLKNCGFIDYGDLINTGEFFTESGLLLVKFLLLKNNILQSDYTDEQKNIAIRKITQSLEILIYNGLHNILKNNKANYSESFKWIVEFLLEFNRINRQEFALMVYVMCGKDKNNWKYILRKDIENYRNNIIDINVNVRVRNDKGDASRSPFVLKDIAYLTSYNYYVGLLVNAGIIDKDSQYYVVKNILKLKELLVV